MTGLGRERADPSEPRLLLDGLGFMVISGVER